MFLHPISPCSNPAQPSHPRHVEGITTTTQRNHAVPAHPPLPGHAMRQCNPRSRSAQPLRGPSQPRPLPGPRSVAPWQPKRRVKAHTTTTQFSRDCNLEADRDGTGLGRPFLVRSGGMVMREKWGMAAQRATPRTNVASGSLHRRRPFAWCPSSHRREQRVVLGFLNKTTHTRPRLNSDRRRRYHRSAPPIDLRRPPN